MSTIRTPDDEIDRPGYFLPPFTEGWHYLGATYAGHSDFSVDFNRRTADGGWLQDDGDPVLAAADGTVAQVDASQGLVMLNHHGALWRTEYRHMKEILVAKGDKLERGRRIGSIGTVGESTSPHLHHVHWTRDALGKAFRRTRMAFEDQPVRSSVLSDRRGKDWEAPEPQFVTGPPPKATWETAYRQTFKALRVANARIAILEAEAPVDCSAETARAQEAEAMIEAVRIAAGCGT